MRKKEIPDNPSPCVALQEFCDMDQLYQLLSNWSNCSGMSAVIVDTQGGRISESYGMTEFCAMIHSVEEGASRCMSTWKDDCQGIYFCHMGYCDFSIPIALPDGQILGRMLAGQALSTEQDDSVILKKTLALGIPEERARDVLSRVHRKTPMEMEAAYPDRASGCAG